MSHKLSDVSSFFDPRPCGTDSAETPVLFWWVEVGDCSLCVFAFGNMGGTWWLPLSRDKVRCLRDKARDGSCPETHSVEWAWSSESRAGGNSFRSEPLRNCEKERSTFSLQAGFLVEFILVEGEALGCASCLPAIQLQKDIGERAAEGFCDLEFTTEEFVDSIQLLA